ncbi:uncharacterized protein [Rutidosis leptorrhynchoides]|uniref:uncharacterized protein n=1 Tax=Rutidosis leptorrhynchoides TaxID=125765 RepID=UPI003A99A882
MEPYNTHQPSSNFQDFRCHSASSSSSTQTQTKNTNYNHPNVVELKKVSSSSRSASRIWSLTDPEIQRKKRVASYKAFTVEGKVKESMKKSCKWIKDRYHKMVYGFR